MLYCSNQFLRSASEPPGLAGGRCCPPGPPRFSLPPVPLGPVLRRTCSLDVSLMRRMKVRDTRDGSDIVDTAYEDERDMMDGRGR